MGQEANLSGQAARERLNYVAQRLGDEPIFDATANYPQARSDDRKRAFAFELREALATLERVREVLPGLLTLADAYCELKGDRVADIRNGRALLAALSVPVEEAMSQNPTANEAAETAEKRDIAPVEESSASLDWESIAEARAEKLKDLAARYSLYSMAMRNAVDILANRGRFGSPDDALDRLRAALATEEPPAEARSEQVEGEG